MTILSQPRTFGGLRLPVPAAAVLCAILAAPAPSRASDDTARTPNILFFIMDDVGIDQMKTFGYGGATPPATPNIDAIAQAGVKFRNTWATPECSPSRSSIFTGRHPHRTNIQAIISDSVLANSQVSPFEVTVPKLLRSNGARYRSGMFGKFHMAGPDNNPFGNGGPHSIGWDYFQGFIEGEPYPIDSWAGATPDPNEESGPHACGYVSGSAAGACRFADGTCEPMAGLRPGLSCISEGGLFEEGGHCASPAQQELNFERANAYYVSPLVINHPDGRVEELPYSDPRARGYRTTLEVDAARDWIRQQDDGTPWMATVSFSSAHVPYQPAPPSFGLPGLPDPANPDCTTDAAVRILSNQTIEAMDKELGRLLVELGLASFDDDGKLHYDPAATDTMIVIVGDNGTYASVVKGPFDPLHSKGTVYQTGVWVPLLVAGPLVSGPGREVSHMVNITDLFALFGEIAGVNVGAAVPRSHALDAVSMLPYLTNPAQPGIREFNFTQSGTSITADNEQPYPCVITVQGAPVCVQLFPSKEVCSSEGGEWYGPDGVRSFDTCCGVRNAEPPVVSPPESLKILPISSWAVRNERFKLVQKEIADCASEGESDIVTEFYEIDEKPTLPRLDRPDGSDDSNNLLPGGADPDTLPPLLKANYDALASELQRQLASEPDCPGDGNLDKMVNGKDLVAWKRFRALSDGGSTWYDFARDGVYDGRTDENDRQVIRDNLGTNCLRGNRKTRGRAGHEMATTRKGGRG